MNVVIAVLLVFALVGLVDKIAGSRLGLGPEFDKGIDLMGAMALALVGITCLGVYAAQVNAGMIAGLARVLPFDPSVIIGCLLAPDMGGLAISLQIAAERNIGVFTGMILSTCVGVTICFQLPICIAGIREKEDKDLIMKGFVIGLVTIIPGVIIAGFMLGLSIKEIVCNAAPVLIICVALAIGFRVSAKAASGVLTVIAGIVRILSLVLFALVILGIFVPKLAIADSEVVKDTFVCCGKMAAVVCGSMVFSKLALTYCKKPFSIIAKLLGTNEVSVVGILMGMTTTFAMLPLFPEMDRRGKLINGAFSVGGAYIIGGQMAFVSSMTTGGEILVFFVTKIIFTVMGIGAVCILDKTTNPA